MHNTFSVKSKVSTTKQVYFPSMILDQTILECRLVDLPTIPKFPSTREEEWDKYRHFSLHSAHSFILVYDVTSPQSFTHVQNIREGIQAVRELADIPIIVVGNKSDLARNKVDDDDELVRREDRGKHEIISLVRKTWRASYVECSARYNWNVTAAFTVVAKEIINHKENVAREVEEDQQGCCKMSVWWS